MGSNGKASNQVLESVGGAKLIVHSDRIVACNRQALTVFHCQREELLSKPLVALSAPFQPNGQRSENLFWEKTSALEINGQQEFEWVFQRNGGETFTMQVTLGQVSAKGKDFTQLALSEVPVSPHVDSAEAAVMKFRFGLESSHDAVFMTDSQARITYINPAFERIYGYSKVEALGKTPRFLKSDKYSEETYRALWQKPLDKEMVTGEIINKTKDGTLINIEVINNPILDKNGRLLGTLSIHRDITERKLNEEALHRERIELEKRVDEQSEELEQTYALMRKQLSELEQTKVDLERQNQLTETLSELAKRTSTTLELQPIFETIIEFTAQIIDATSAYVSQIDLETNTATVVAEYLSPYASEAEQVSDLGTTYDMAEEFGDSPETYREQGETYIAYVDSPDRSPEERAHMEKFGAESILGIVLFVKGEPVAEVEFWESRHKREYTDEEIELVKAIAHQVAVPLENARLYSRARNELLERRQLEQKSRRSLERRSRQVELSTQVTQDIVAATNLSDLYQRVVNQVKEQFNYYHVQLLRYEPLVDAVVLIAGYGEVGQQMLAAGHRMPLGLGLIGTAAFTGKSVLQPNVGDNPNWQPNPLLPDTKSELAVPIMLRDEVMGVLDVQSNVTGAIDEDDKLALEGLCGQIAIAIESTLLRREMADRLEELNQLQRIMSREGWLSFRAQQDSSIKGYHFTKTEVQPVYTSELKLPNGKHNDGEVDRSAPTHERPYDKLSMPMTVRGEIIGNLGIEDDPENPLTPEDRALLDSISVQVAEALESARLLEQTQKHAIEMEAVAQVSAAASTILDAPKLLYTVTKLTKKRFDLYHVAVFMLDDDSLYLAAGTAFPTTYSSDESPLDLKLSQEQSLVAQAARLGQAVVANDVMREPNYRAHPLLTETKAELAIPLLVGEQLLGVLDLQSDVSNRFSEDDVRIQTTLAAQVSVALQNAFLYAEQLETTERLREVDRLKSEFLASMSHELRTPLNSIIGFADVMLEGIDGPLNERMQQDVTLIRDSGQHLRMLIGEMLDMSKIEAGMMELHYEPVDVPTLANEVMANAKSLAKDKKLEIQLDIDSGVGVVEADRTRFLQVLLNLMSNAIKFTSDGSVVLSMKSKNDNLLVSVKDTGIGMREEDIPIIFEQFRQIDGSMTRVAGGTGLGIPISKSLVELHGGEMWVDSKPGAGSTFWFTIPKKKQSV